MHSGFGKKCLNDITITNILKYAKQLLCRKADRKWEENAVEEEWLGYMEQGSFSENRLEQRPEESKGVVRYQLWTHTQEKKHRYKANGAHLGNEDRKIQGTRGG